MRVHTTRHDKCILSVYDLCCGEESGQILTNSQDLAILDDDVLARMDVGCGDLSIQPLSDGSAVMSHGTVDTHNCRIHNQKINLHLELGVLRSAVVVAHQEARKYTIP